MYCRKCGALNEDNVANCSQCGEGMQPVAPVGYQAKPAVPDYLVWTILATIFCCVPAGIVAIVYSTQVRTKLAQGDYAGAEQSSDNAKTWAYVALGLGLVAFVIRMAMIGSKYH